MLLLRLLAGYAAGLLVSAYFPHIGLPLLVAGFATTGLAFFVLPIDRAKPIFLLAALFFAGALQYQFQTTPPENDQHICRSADSGNLLLEGTVIQHQTRPNHGAVLLIETCAAGRHAPLAPTYGRVQVTVETDSTPLRPGDQVRLQTVLRRPQRFETPGEFDTPRHLAWRNIFVTGFIRDSRDIVRFTAIADAPFSLTLQRFRQQVGAHIDAHIDRQTAPLLRALATGERGSIEPDQRALLARGGIAHLFAISGLHLGLVAGLLYFLSLTLYRYSPHLLQFSPPKRLLPLLLLPVLAAYLVFTGSALSTWRALLLLSLLALAGLTRRRTTGPGLLVAAAGLVLFFDPLALFEASFQLSFAGAAGIVAVWPRWLQLSRRLPRLATPPLSIAVASAAATLATLPFVLFHFHLLAPAGLLLNLVAVPVVSLIAVPATLAGTVILPWLPQTATFFLTIAGFCLDRLLALTTITLALPGLGGTLQFLSPVALLIIGLLSWVLLFSAWSWPRRAATILAGTLLLTGFHFAPPWPDRLRVAALSVGQGDATLLQTAGGKSYLIDGGGLYNANFDTGERLVAPALGRLGIRHLDAILLTHPHPDHTNGLVYILQHFPTKEFWSPLPASALPAPLQSVLAQRQIPIRIFPAGWSQPDPFNPEIALFVAQNQSSANNASLVTYARNGNDGVLLTGDLEQDGINALCLALPPGPVTLIKIPHHGSRKSLPGPLLTRLRPLQAFVSVGRNNRYGQPHPLVLAELQSARIPLHRTDLNGSLLFTSNQHGWTTQTWRYGLFR